MKSKRISLMISLVMCMMFACAGHSSAEEFGWPPPGCTTINAAYTYPSSGNRHRCRYSTPDGRAAGVDINVGMGI